MTNKEAIKYLIVPIATSTEPSAEYLKQKEAYDLAIKALENQTTEGDLISRDALKNALNYIYDCAYTHAEGRDYGMKSITCDKCHRLLESGEPYRELSSEQFVSHIGDTRTLLFEHYATYDLCDKCNEEFNTFIRSSIYQFLKGNRE